ncbi:MAG TPA: diguanylate cyclase [Thermoleophilia bacterium]|nr:diguanylate cyclase [Thermoleophilia bacterium]
MSTLDNGLLANLIQLGNLLRSSPDVPGVVRAIATGAARTFGFNEVVIYLRAPGETAFRAQAVVGRDEARDQAILATPLPASLIERFMLEERQVGCAFFTDHREHDYTDEEREILLLTDLGPRAPHEWQTGDLLLVPLRDRAGRASGLLELADPSDRKLPTLDLAKELEVFATFAIAAVESARQYEELERATLLLEQQLQVRHDLLELSGSLLSTLDHNAVFGQIADVLKSLVDYDTIDIALVDEGARELVTIFAQDKWANEMLQFRQSIDQGVGGWVVRHDEPQLVNDMNNDPRGIVVPGTDVEPQASILVPLRFMGAVIGLLAVDRLAGRTFEERELELVQLFANMAAIAIRNARSFKEMEVQASTDGLTGLYNHRRFQEALAVEVARAERYDSSFCLLMMDLDRFKAVNDTVGHQRGDEVLREVAAVLRRCSRESDFAARYGGEEFAMILPHTDVAEAGQVAERIRRLVSELATPEAEVRVTVSIGVASFPGDASDTDGILGAADASLLSAKARGRDCVHTFGIDQAAEPLPPEVESALSALGQRFALRIGLSGEEARALSAALQVVERARPAAELRLAGRNGDQRGPAPTVSHLFAALLYGTERWDGGGYPEGLRGDSIPPIARAFAVVRAYAAGGRDAAAEVRAGSGRQFDPRMVNRLLAFVAEEASRYDPLDGLADDRGA